MCQLALQTDPKAIRDFLLDHLVNHVIPFWTKYCVDWELGGFSNLVTDEGKRVSDEKYMYSQGRALYTYAALYHYIDKKQEYLDICDCVASFILKTHRPGKDWGFRLNPDGSVVDSTKSCYVDAYMCTGMVEYWAVTGKQEALDLALEIYERANPRLDDPATLSAAPLFNPPGMQTHGPIMHSSFAFFLLGKMTGRIDIQERAKALACRALEQHMDDELELIYEFAAIGGGRAPGDYGQTVVVGHAIEGMWFYEEIFDHFKMRDHVRKTLRLIQTHFDFGWDKEYGGIYLARHAMPGVTPKWHNPETKSWWPQVESLYAMLRAYEISADPYFADGFDKLYAYIFSHFPNPEHGEWHHCLDRQGNLRGQIATIPVKDPFHMPRALIKCVLALDRMLAK